jgi:carbon storage regulator
MLILSRKLNESIVIDGRITVKVVRIDGETVKLGIAAPADVPVHRQEVYEEIRKSNLEAATQRTLLVPKLSASSAASQKTKVPDAGRTASITPTRSVKTETEHKTPLV